MNNHNKFISYIIVLLANGVFCFGIPSLASDTNTSFSSNLNASTQDEIQIKAVKDSMNAAARLFNTYAFFGERTACLRGPLGQGIDLSGTNGVSIGWPFFAASYEKDCKRGLPPNVYVPCTKYWDNNSSSYISCVNDRNNPNDYIGKTYIDPNPASGLIDFLNMGYVNRYGFVMYGGAILSNGDKFVCSISSDLSLEIRCARM